MIDRCWLPFCCLALLAFSPASAILQDAEDDAAVREMRGEVRKLQPKIDEAIDKGVAWLISKQRPNGTWPGDDEHYPSGQTALSVYTLLKMGLSSEHAAVARGLLAMLARPPGQTYAAGCQLMAFEATGDPDYRPRMQEILEDLLEWQERGLWSYPYAHGQPWSDGKGLVDLSNTQYAALGLRACRLAGLEVPQRAWREMLDRVDGARISLDAKELKELSYGGTRGLSGYRYRPGGGNATGSMTAAGIAITQIAMEGLQLPPNHALRRSSERLLREGVEWLGLHFKVDGNPNHGQNWLYYYLYGVERVGSFLDTERLGPHFWYLEGARFLIQKQSKEGTWRQRSVEADTCFGLLFLKRASFGGATTGVKAGPSARAMVCDGPESEVHLRGTGLPRTTVWLTGFADAVLERFGGPPCVKRVEYTIDGEVVATAESEQEEQNEPWDIDQRFAIQHEFTRPGKYLLGARVEVLGPAKEGGERERSTLSAKGFTVEMQSQSGASYVRLAKGLVANQVPRSRPSSSVSTRIDPSSGGDATTDGDFATRWLCEASDTTPWIKVKLRRRQDVSRIVLAQAAITPEEAASFDTILAVEVFLNGSTRGQVVRLEEDPLVPTWITLDKPLRLQSLEIRVLERRPGKPGGRSGFSEIGAIE